LRHTFQGARQDQQRCTCWWKPDNADVRLVLPPWIFGYIDQGTGAFFMELVPQRDAATLQPIMQRSIALGTCIWSEHCVMFGS